jgi:cellulose synthase/poly-beta-1,6-N-acetylglucosamine synthase-like glycosyltransferase
MRSSLQAQRLQHTPACLGAIDTAGNNTSGFLTNALLLARVPAGVWRIKAINDAGGWESDTVVEDMDLSLRVYLKGWRSIYLHDVKCPNELPSTLSAYKTQQFRWLSGPMQIVRKSFANIWFSK